jgi:hypothetical protein
MKYFIKQKEDFVCERCGAEVKGSGYTNHCPKCLWSKHVDLFPGDRLNRCQGMMKPVAVEVEGDTYLILHVCEVCGFDKRNRVEKNDDFDVVIQISKDHAKKLLEPNG